MYRTPISDKAAKQRQDVDAIYQSETLDRYKLQSSRLKWNEDEKTLSILKSDNTTKDYDFRTFFFPACAGVPTSTSVVSNDLYINTLLFQIDLSVGRRGKKTKNDIKAVSNPIYIFMCVMTYFRNKGIYRLNDIQHNEMVELGKKLGENPWHIVFGIKNRWHKALDDLESNDIDVEKNILFQTNTKGNIESLNKKFWEKKVGYGACATYSYDTKQRILQYCENRGYLYEKKFKEWLEKETHESTISKSSFYLGLIKINHLATKMQDIDYLQSIPFINPTQFYQKYCKGTDGRTENFPLSDTIFLLKRSLELVFCQGAEFVAILKNINQQEFIVQSKSKNPAKNKKLLFKNLASRWTLDFLKNEKPFDTLTTKMGLPPIRYWAPTAPCKNSTAISLIHFIALIQGACCIVILFLNARRIGEVTDKVTGLKIPDFSQLDDELDIYQCNFYIEKTYQERHPFYVNRTTACAIQLLIDMKTSLSELMTKPDSECLFSICNPVPLIRSKELTLRYFDFSHPGSTLSISTLMRYLYPNGNAPVLKSHMGRRFFGLLYHYRYDNADLLSLRQQLRHFDIVMTKVYITDPDLRDDAKDIASTIGKRKDVTLVDKKLYDSLELEIKDLENEIEAAGRERLTDIITHIISGGQSAGGFTRFIRKLFRRFATDMEFLESSPNEQGKILSERLQAQGYKPNSMPHGQCNAPKPKGALNAKCRDQDNQTNIERACADLCRDCQYHYNNEGFLQNLEDDAKQLKEDMDNFMLPPMQQKTAKDDYENLIKIIELNKETMEKNRQLMMTTIQELYE
jgi:hypothetical protein